MTLKTIDADAHVLETPFTWEFMHEGERKFAPFVVTQNGHDGSGRREFWVVDNRLQPKNANIGLDTPEDAREMRDLDFRLKHMDELEVDVQVLYPTLMLRPAIQHRATELAMARSYNRWLAEIWKKGKGRLRWVAIPALLSMDTVRDEMRFAKDNGACGIFIRALEYEKRLTNPEFFPLYEIASELDLAICIHAGTNSTAMFDLYEGECGFARFKLPVVGIFHSLLMERTPSMFPKVRWGFVEVSAQWIPYALNDYRLRLERLGRPIPANPMAENRMYVACQVTDDLAAVLKDAGEDNLVVGTDYGHNDTSSQIQALRLLRNDGKVPAPIVDKILGDNARAMYGL
jgi:predicted TIM-barrel fold metal-dependent hydrolase